MPTFIDESGDIGYARDSKPFFRVAAVWVPSPEAANQFRSSIRSIRPRLGLRGDYEFKFSKTAQQPRRREEFFRIALECGFRFAVVCVDKTSPRWREGASKDLFFFATTHYLAVTLRDVYHAAELQSQRRRKEPIVVDDNKDGDFLAAIDWSFRRLASAKNPEQSMVGKAYFEKSDHDELLQLADMTCGAVGDHVEGKSRWYSQIRPAGVGPDVGWGPGVSVYNERTRQEEIPLPRWLVEGMQSSVLPAPCPL